MSGSEGPPAQATTLGVVAANPTDVVLGFAYDASGEGWCVIVDHPLLAWRVGDDGMGYPVALGEPPGDPPDTGDILSPPLAYRSQGLVYVPEMLRAINMAQLWAFLSTNNGARRKLLANIADATLADSFRAWAGSNPDLVLEQLPVEMVEAHPAIARGLA